MPHVPQVLKCSLIELSCDDDSITNIIFFPSNSGGGIVIVSSPTNFKNEDSQPISVSSVQGSGSSVGATPSSYPLHHLSVSEMPPEKENMGTSFNCTRQSVGSDTDQIASESHCVRKVSNIPPI